MRQYLRGIALRLLPPFLLLIFLSILAAQFVELGTANELLSLTSFIILISFSALAFNWCRVPTTFTHETLLIVIYQAGMDFFIASLLALVSTFFAWLQMTPLLLPKNFQPILFGLHWIFLLLSLGLFLLAIIKLLETSKVIFRGKD